MTSITVFKTQFTIGAIAKRCCKQIAVDAYTANQISATTGKFINYLSGAGLAKSIGLANTTTMQKRMPEDLKAILGKGLTPMQGSYKMESGGKAKINLWDTTSAALYYRYHDKQVASLFGLSTNNATRDIKAILAGDSGLIKAKTNRNTGDAKNATEVALNLSQ